MGDSTSEADDVSGKDWQHAYLQNMDWTQHLPSTEHVQFLKSVDWSKTHVGPIAKWPSALRQATYQLIADSRPATLYWQVILSAGTIMADNIAGEPNMFPYTMLRSFHWLERHIPP